MAFQGRCSTTAKVAFQAEKEKAHLVPVGYFLPELI
jgi:hypothetical protein